jgi:hypothetical protein
VFPLARRRAKVEFEVTLAGRRRLPKHQPKSASRLRWSWTYVDSGETTSPLSSKDDPVSPLSSSSSSFIEQVSPLSSEKGRPSIEAGKAGSPPHLPQQPAPSSPSKDSSSSGSISSHIPAHTPLSYLIQADTPRGMRLLAQIRKFLAMPNSKTPQEVSTFIDLHPDLMKAIRAGLVPTRERKAADYESELRREKNEAIVDPIMRRLRARDDPKYRFMLQNLLYALKRLDWDEIDSAPIPSTSWSWDILKLGDDGNEAIDDDEEEECDSWVRMTVWPDPNHLALMKHRCREPTPLRTTLTRREDGQT